MSRSVQRTYWARGYLDGFLCKGIWGSISESLSTHLCCWWLLVNYMVLQSHRWGNQKTIGTNLGMEKWFHGYQVLSSSVKVRLTAWTDCTSTRKMGLFADSPFFLEPLHLGNSEEGRCPILPENTLSLTPITEFSENPTQVGSSWENLVGTLSRLLVHWGVSLGFLWLTRRHLRGYLASAACLKQSFPPPATHAPAPP